MEFDALPHYLKITCFLHMYSRIPIDWFFKKQKIQ